MDTLADRPQTTSRPILAHGPLTVPRLLGLTCFALFFPNPAIPVGSAVGIQSGQLLALLILPVLVTAHRPRRHIVAAALLIIPLLASGVVQTAMGDQTDLVLKAVALELLVLPALIIAGSAIERGCKKQLVIAACVAITVHGAVSLHQFVAFDQGEFPFLFLFQNPSFLQPTDAYALYVRRVTGLYSEPSALAAACGPWVVLLAGLSISSEAAQQVGFSRRLPLFAGAVTGLAVILLSGTGYAFFLVVSLGLVTMRHVLFRQGARRRSTSAALGLLAVAGVVALVATGTLRDRVDNAVAQSWGSRLISIKVGLMGMIEGPSQLLFGVGPGLSSEWVEKAGASEPAFGNIPVLAVWSVLGRYVSETGVVGLLAIGVIGSFVASAIFRSSERLLGWAAAVAWLIAIALATSYAELEPPWLFLGVLLGWNQVFPRSRAARLRPIASFAAA